MLSGSEPSESFKQAFSTQYCDTLFVTLFNIMTKSTVSLQDSLPNLNDLLKSNEPKDLIEDGDSYLHESEFVKRPKKYSRSKKNHRPGKMNK